MRCTKCGSDNREGRKFCSKCGLALVRPCPQCGASNEPGEDFCGECGAALVAAAGSPQVASTAPDIRIAPEQPAGDLLDGERKTVTALFADIKGSMELMEDLDPEEARAIIDPALKLMIDAVCRPIRRLSCAELMLLSPSEAFICWTRQSAAARVEPQPASSRSGSAESRRSSTSTSPC